MSTFKGKCTAFLGRLSAWLYEGEADGEDPPELPDEILYWYRAGAGDTPWICIEVFEIAGRDEARQSPWRCVVLERDRGRERIQMSSSDIEKGDEVRLRRKTNFHGLSRSLVDSYMEAYPVTARKSSLIQFPSHE